MRNTVLGLVIGLVVGVGGGWLLASITVVDAVEQKLAEEKSLAETSRKELETLRSKYDGLVESSAAELAQVTDRLSEKDEQVAALEAEKEGIASELAQLQVEKEKLIEAVEAYRKKCDDMTAGPAEVKPEDPDEQYRQQIIEILQRVTPVGGPLNELAVKELGLDENQVAGINEALKEEAERMRKRILDWAAGFIKDKTAEELAQMSNIKLGYAVGQHVTDELEIIQNLKPEVRRTLHVKNHFIKFLPRGGKLVGIVKSLYEERQKTYGSLGAYLSEEQEKALKEKHVTSGTFIFPGLGSFGIGHLKPEDFEE